MSNEKVDGIQPMYVQAQAQVVSQPGQQQEQPESLIPYPDETNWHTSECACERCCACQGECWMAWCCSCFSLGHISSKLEALGQPCCLKYSHIVMIGVALTIVDIILSVVMSRPGRPAMRQPRLAGLFFFFVTFQMRRAISRRLKFADNCCFDCLWSFFCTPCVITQMNGTLWKQPDDLGCSCDDKFAQVV
mmetsp:Transcript_10784/g.14059  ORF Transcript_10784/g.14059 Transcript_10784/m.14059 type:complete len:191 (+) Transcript_10784:72-644(+)